MPKFNKVNYKEVLTEVAVIHRCPYCSKQFFNRKSYRNHILGGYCINCDIKTGKSIDVEIPLEWLKGEKK